MRRAIKDILATTPPSITGRQVRAARMLAGMTRLELGEKAGISERTITAIEQFEEEPISTLLQTRLSLVEALWQAGVKLKDNEGVERMAS